MKGMPVPQGFLETPATLKDESSGELEASESGFILDATLNARNRKDPMVIAFIDSFIRCKNIAEASSDAGIKASEGYKIRHRKDVSAAIQKLIDKSTVKYGFDASEIVERTKEMVDFDPIEMMNADGTYKDNMFDIEPAARRNIKKLKVHNLYNQIEDLNGMKKKIIIGKVIEYEFYDKLKAIDLVGREKELFKTTTRVEHDVTKNMASILLASAERGTKQSLVYAPKTIEVESHTVKED
jgi:hypothetical protein